MTANALFKEMDEDLREIVTARAAGEPPHSFNDVAESYQRHVDTHGPWVPATPHYTNPSDYIKRMDVGALIELETWRRICDFAQTSTLDDRIESTRARSLYRLGRQVTLIGHQHLATMMGGPGRPTT